MKIYTDSSFDEKRKLAGWGVVIIDGQKRRVFSNWTKAPDNNFGEMHAIYMAAVISGGKEATLYTDSQTALDYIEGRRGAEYESKHKKEWTHSQYIRHKQMQLMAYKIKRANPRLAFDKIKGHQRDYKLHALGNNLADLMAKEGRAKYYER